MTRSLLCTALLVLALSAPVLGESKTFELSVAAGDRDRAQVPVCVRLFVPEALARAEAVTLEDSAGKRLPAQLTALDLLASHQKREGRPGAVERELHFILPTLKASQTASFKATLSSEASAKVEGFVWHDTPGEFMELRFGKRPVLRYMYKAIDESSKEKRDETYKVFHHLFDPTGERLVTKGAGGRYPHHRGLYFGFNRVSYGDDLKLKADTWHCTGDAYQSHEKFIAAEAGPVLGRHRLEIAWHGQGKKVFAVEERELTVYHVPDGQLVEFATLLRTAGGKVKLDGDPQHAGFQFRADQEVAATTAKQTYYLRPDGQGQPGQTRNWPADKGHINLPWNAMSFVLGSQRYTACYLDRPTNPKEARFSERDYGRFGSYFEYELADGKTLALDYRLWLQKGEMTGPQVEALSNNFVKPVVVTVK